MGRPTKYNERRAGRACDLLRLGCTRKASAAGAGVAFTTFLRWERSFAPFATALARAEAECAVQMTLAIIHAAEGGDWRAALAWLKAMRREDWGGA